MLIYKVNYLRLCIFSQYLLTFITDLLYVKNTVISEKLL